MYICYICIPIAIFAASPCIKTVPGSLHHQGADATTDGSSEEKLSKCHLCLETMGKITVLYM